MLFRDLCVSPTLDLQRYVDIDHFHESERYAHAESIPLKAQEFSVVRASLSLPLCRLSLVRTFPRIINGYELSGRLIVVIPMNEVSSTRVNGRPIGQSLILLRGKANCTVLEPEGRLVAIMSVDGALSDRSLPGFVNGLLLARLPAAALARLQISIRGVLKFAATEAAVMTVADVLQKTQDTLLASVNEAFHAAQKYRSGGELTLDHYKGIVDQIDDLIGLNPIDLNNERLADSIGASVRTLQTAARTICGSGLYRYSRLRRLWSVRRQLRTGAPSLTVKASALAHGFWHQSEFSAAYNAAFGELPSQTLKQARLSG
jgi:AraC family ethanolamine operon transcriptional activator